MWCTLNLGKKINNKFELFLTEEYRLKENFSTSNLFYTDLGATYKPAGILKISFAYRCIQKFQLDKSVSFRHRGMLDIILKKKFGQFAFSYRQRIQTEVRDVYSSEIGNIPEWCSRNKFQLKYDLESNPVTPYISAEFTYQFSNPRMPKAQHLWNLNRYFIGLDYKKNNRDSFGIYYMIQRDHNVSSPQNLYILGLEYSLSFQ